MMWRAATRRIVTAIRDKYDHPAGSLFFLGENFVGEDDFDLLKYELGPFGLTSEFHFPLMWALRGAIADESQPMSAIDAVNGGISDWAGSGATMATMIGNHDVRPLRDRERRGRRRRQVDSGRATPAKQRCVREAGSRPRRRLQPPRSPGHLLRKLSRAGRSQRSGLAPRDAVGERPELSPAYDPRGGQALARVRGCSAALRRETYRLLRER